MMTLEEFCKSDKKLCIFLSKHIKKKIEPLVLYRPDCFLLQRHDTYMELSETPYMLLNKNAWFKNLENNLETTAKTYIINEYMDQELNIFAIEEFNELLSSKVNDNHEKDVADYMGKCFERIKNMNLLSYATIKNDKLPKQRDMLIINKDKKYVIYKVNNKEYRVDCHKDDEFNWQVGFGLALSKCFGKQYKWQRARENFRHNIINEDDGSVKRVLDYESYSKWCIYEYYHNDTDDMAKLVQKVKEINELGKVDL